MAAKVVEPLHLDQLIGLLSSDGFTVVGPTIRDQAIVYDRIESMDQLPIGWTDHQDGGSYELVRRQDKALFGYVVGPQSWKQFLFPSRSTLFTIENTTDGLRFAQPEADETKYAFIGVRACELAAIAIQDKVFLDSGYVDRTYLNNRKGLFTVGVNCAVAGGTCFCDSMSTGPECESGYDLVMTEVLDDDSHEFVVRSGSPAGERVLSELEGRTATDEDHAKVVAIIADTTAHMGREIDTEGVKELLYSMQEHPLWADVASRCLSCGNCTLVCPTCFCSTTEDTASLDSATATRMRRWDSCFTMEFTALHGTPVRASTESRYRQWMTHKMATWQDQFGTSGCVGCGRCITWCPVGIDITAELAAMRSGLESSA